MATSHYGSLQCCVLRADRAVACAPEGSLTGVEAAGGEPMAMSCLLDVGRGKVLEGVVLVLMPRRPSCFTGPKLDTLNCPSSFLAEETEEEIRTCIPSCDSHMTVTCKSHD